MASCRAPCLLHPGTLIQREHGRNRGGARSASTPPPAAAAQSARASCWPRTQTRERWRRSSMEMPAGRERDGGPGAARVRQRARTRRDGRRSGGGPPLTRRSSPRMSSDRSIRRRSGPSALSDRPRLLEAVEWRTRSHASLLHVQI
jgi:hypothetical protein